MENDRSATLAQGLGDTEVPGASEPARESTPSGVPFGRYIVIETLGRGGMGVVYRAYDPKLQREVALKVLRLATLSEGAERRLVREARAMAQLSHPHVVAVYDVEDFDGQLVLAMEYVPGTTLRQWLRAEQRSVPQILDAFVQAGRGLAAAHHEGLMHRDFKPDNVLVGREGRVRVADFGLARGDGAVAPQSDPSPSLEGPFDAQPSAGSLTEAGVVMGTPRYMAPEQYAGRSLTPAVDQYALCLALWEALTRTDPFPEPLHARAAAKSKGPPPWPGGSSVPRSVVEAIRRGLEPEPQERWPSMDALLARLSYDPGRARRVWGAIALVVATASGIGWSVSTAHRSTSAPCTGAAAQLAEVWHPARRDAIEAAILGTSVSYAAGVWERLGPRLDEWAAQWAQMHTQTCEATAVRAEQSVAVMDLRMACLHQARMQLDAVAAVLEGTDEQTVRRAHDVVGGLPRLERCADVEALRAEVPPPDPAEVEAVDELYRVVARATALRLAGDYDASLRSMQQAAQMLQGIEYPPVHGSVAYQLAFAYRAVGEFEPALRGLGDAQRLGMQQGRRRLVARATAGLIQVLGYDLGRLDEALVLRDLALGLTGTDPHAEVELRRAVGNVLTQRGDYEDGEAQLRASLEIAQRSLGKDHAEAAYGHGSLGVVLEAQGRYDEAEAEYRAAIEIRSRQLGPDHPLTAAARNNVANILFERGRYDEAEAEYRAVLEIAERAHGQHPQSAGVRHNLAFVLATQGKVEEAMEQYRMALEHRREALGDAHIDTAMTRVNLGALLLDQGDYEAAEAELRAAKQSFEVAVDDDHPLLAAVQTNIGVVLHRQGASEEAEVELRAGLAGRERALGPDHPDVAWSLMGLGELLIDVGRADEAAPLLERARTLREASSTAPVLRAETAYVLAKALGSDPKHKERARAMAQEAIELYERAEGSHEEALEQAREFLRTR